MLDDTFYSNEDLELQLFTEVTLKCNYDDFRDNSTHFQYQVSSSEDELLVNPSVSEKFRSKIPPASFESTPMCSSVVIDSAEVPSHLSLSQLNDLATGLILETPTEFDIYLNTVQQFTPNHHRNYSLVGEHYISQNKPIVPSKENLFDKIEDSETKAPDNDLVESISKFHSFSAIQPNDLHEQDALLESLDAYLLMFSSILSSQYDMNIEIE